MSGTGLRNHFCICIARRDPGIAHDHRRLYHTRYDCYSEHETARKRTKFQQRLKSIKIPWIGHDNKESWPKGPGFGLPLKGAVLLKTVEVKSVYLWLASWPVLNYGQTGITGRRAQPFLTIAHFKLLQRFFRQSRSKINHLWTDIDLRVHMYGNTVEIPYILNQTTLHSFCNLVPL